MHVEQLEKLGEHELHVFPVVEYWRTVSFPDLVPDVFVVRAHRPSEPLGIIVK